MGDSERIKSEEVALWHPGFPTSRIPFTSGSETQLLMGAAGIGRAGGGGGAPDPAQQGNSMPRKSKMIGLAAVVKQNSEE